MSLCTAGEFVTATATVAFRCRRRRNSAAAAAAVAFRTIDSNFRSCSASANFAVAPIKWQPTRTLIIGLDQTAVAYQGFNADSFFGRRTAIQHNDLLATRSQESFQCAQYQYCQVLTQWCRSMYYCSTYYYYVLLYSARHDCRTTNGRTIERRKEGSLRKLGSSKSIGRLRARRMLRLLIHTGRK